MKKGFSALESLIVLIIIVILYLAFGNGTNPIKSFVNERTTIKDQQKIIDQKVEDLQKFRYEHSRKIEDDLEQNY